jgi:hypothetical protein
MSAKELAMKKSVKSLLFSLSLPALLLVDLSPETLLGLGIAREAAAIVGAPLTPVSGAGVARRTTRRVVVASSASASATTTQQQQATAQQQSATAQQQSATAQQQSATAQQQAAAAQSAPPAPAPAQPAGAPAIGTIVPALPAGCVPTSKGGVEYYKCGNVWYRTAFQGNNLVYVVQQQP